MRLLRCGGDSPRLEGVHRVDLFRRNPGCVRFRLFQGERPCHCASVTVSLRTICRLVSPLFGQALEAACWIPILKGKRLVLAGDHKQLAPTVKSRAAEIGETANAFTSDGAPKGSNGLGLTMFDRVMRDHGSGVSRMLNLQYRMHEDICKWASREVSALRWTSRAKLLSKYRAIGHESSLEG